MEERNPDVGNLGRGGGLTVVRVGGRLSMELLSAFRCAAASEKPFKGLTIREALDFFRFLRRRMYKNGLYTLKQLIEFKGAKRSINGTFKGIR